MTSPANRGASDPNVIVRLQLGQGAENPELVELLHNLCTRGRYRIILDVSAVSHLGTTDLRILDSYAERCRQHGGYLKLENAGTQLADLVRGYGCCQLLAGTSEHASLRRAGAGAR